MKEEDFSTLPQVRISSLSENGILALARIFSLSKNELT